VPTPDTQGVPPFADFEDLKRKINEIVQKYNNLLVNLDSLNVVSLTADHIDAGTINAGLVRILSNLNAGAFISIDGNGLVINNGTLDTFIADINGAVTMTSALIQSATGYPKVVMDPATELFGAYAAADKFINILANDSGDPLLYFNNALNLVRIALLGDTFSIGAFGKMVLGSTGDVEISATGSGSNVNLTPASGRVTLPEWNRIYSRDLTQTLQQALDAKSNKGVSTSLSGGHNHGIPDGTRLAVVNGAGEVTGSVIYSVASNHSHSQN
jgi:hypothetical protein